MAEKKKAKFKELKHQPEPVFVKYYHAAFAVCTLYLLYAFFAG